MVLCTRGCGTGVSTTLKLYPRIQFASFINIIHSGDLTAKSNSEMHKIGHESALSVERPSGNM